MPRTLDKRVKKGRSIFVSEAVNGCAAYFAQEDHERKIYIIFVLEAVGGFAYF